MPTRLRSIIYISTILVAIMTPSSVLAQAPGYADITRPQQGEAIFGLVTIEGSAAHPSFVYYELSFAYQPNPSDTWFPIMQPIQTPVTDGRLGIWDTTGITDGNYQLRLIVWLENGKSLEAIVSDLRIRNTTPTETPAATKPAALLSPSPVIPTDTPLPTQIPSSSNIGSSRVMRAFLIGGVVCLVSLLSLGGFIIVRRYLQIHWSTLRMRHIHRRSEQRRGRKRRGQR